MKNILLVSLLIFVCKSLPASGLSEEKLWAIALTGIMNEYNKTSHTTLNSLPMNERNKKAWLTVLNRDWGVFSREDLIETLDKTEKDGHAASFRFIHQIISEGILNISVNDFGMIYVNTNYNEYRLSQRQLNYLKYVESFWDRYENRDIIVWDLGRNVALCRWGYDVGFFTEEEAWEKIMYYAKLIQPLYNSWEEYGYDYFLGRVFWASGFGEEVRYEVQTYAFYEKLIGKNGHWSKLKWNINLK